MRDREDLERISSSDTEVAVVSGRLPPGLTVRNFRLDGGSHITLFALVGLIGLRHPVQITRIAPVLCWNRGRRHPRRTVEIEELGHIHLGLIPVGEGRKTVPRFDELQDRREIRDCVGDVVSLRKWGDDNQGYAIAGPFTV